jgi:hypothetical protein
MSLSKDILRSLWSLVIVFQPTLDENFIFPHIHVLFSIYWTGIFKYLDKKIIEKPKDEKDAFQMIKRYCSYTWQDRKAYFNYKLLHVCVPFVVVLYATNRIK